MGFGSYDESEQRQPDAHSDDEEEAAVNVHENSYDGAVTVDTGASTDDLLGQLADIKEKKEE